MSNSENNPFENGRDRRERQAFAAVESLVRAAGNYVQPTDDLRPSTLEAARRSTSLRRWNKRLAGIAALVVVLAVSNIPGRFLPEPAESTLAHQTVTREFELRQESAKEMGVTFNPAWAWVEAFFELRNKQANLIND